MNNPRLLSPHGQLSDCYDAVRMGARAAVVSNHPVASSVGMAVLANGGNAVDAAVAVGFAIGVAEPNGSGIGGDGYVMVHQASTRSVHVVNGTGASPLAARPELGLDRLGMRSASVPGLVDAMLEAHARWGRLPLMQCVEPAIALCDVGVPVSFFQAEMTRKYDRLHAGGAAAAAIFAPQGRPLKAGELRRNPLLGRTYRQIAEHGRDYFYNGPVARAVSELSAASGGLLQLDDFVRHRVRVEGPITSTYRGHHVYEAGPNSSGHLLLQQLNMLEQFDVPAMRFLSPQLVHLMVEAKRLAYIDREAFLSDPDDTDIPMDGLLSKSYAAERAALIDPNRAAKRVAPGNPWPHGGGTPGRARPREFAVVNAREDTTHFCVVDSEGNAVSQLQSLNMMFGSQVVVPGTGMLLNNRMAYWHLDPAHPNYLRAGARTRHTMNPVMVFPEAVENGAKLRWVMGTPGGDTQVQSTFQAISALVDHRLNEAEAVQARRWSHDQDGTYSNHPHAVEESLIIEERFGEHELADQLEAGGHHVVRVAAWEARGSLGIIGVHPDSAARMAAADPRRDGQAQAM